MAQGGALLLIMALAAQNQQHAQLQQHVQVQQQQAERFCLTQALYYEARGEGELGQLAVADVILQRQRSKYHPKTICGVVYQPYQFSFVSDGSMLREIDMEAWDKADDLSGRILSGKIRTGLTGHALFYHTKAVRPDWADAMVKTTEIGNHIFYRQVARRS
jgi:spore germination cell wall hydrolase CwlJ-like protein